jgi:hypothetical protein
MPYIVKRSNNTDSIYLNAATRDYDDYPALFTSIEEAESVLVLDGCSTNGPMIKFDGYENPEFIEVKDEAEAISMYENEGFIKGQVKTLGPCSIFKWGYK